VTEEHSVALRFCGALSIDCDSKSLMWRSAAIIAAHARMQNAADVIRAIAYGRGQGWIEADGNGNVCLTLRGSLLIGPKRVRFN
jgi:hypothetical protein